MIRIAALAGALLWTLTSALPSFAQSSESFRLTDSAFHAGGRPLDGTVAASASFRVSLDAIGDAVVGTGPASVSFRSDGGFVSAYSPPGEVDGVRWTDSTTLSWSAEPSVGVYDVYRDALYAPTSGGVCFAPDLATATTPDPGVPSAGRGWFYLVTASNRLGEEGTKGRRSDGTLRPNSTPCP